MFGLGSKRSIPDPTSALPGRDLPLGSLPDRHPLLGTSLQGPWPQGSQILYVAMGCFWGAERIFYRMPGVVSTAVGYMGGFTPHATYEEVCSGRTGHTEAVQIVYDPAKVGTEELMATFWENHDPTQGFRQGNDVGTQYRSAVYWTTQEQELAVRATRDAFQGVLTRAGYGEITTELRPAAQAGEFFYAEAYHQQYLHKNPGGYCNHGPNGMTCPVGLLRQDEVPAQQDVLPPH